MIRTLLRPAWRRIRDFYRRRTVEARSWQEIEYFDAEWRERIAKMATHVSPRTSVLDLGCGPMWLKEFLPNNEYIGVDYKARAPDTVVCDFNAGEFPAHRVDVAVVSGCLEYITDYRWFIGEIARHSSRCVISYCLLERYPDLVQRRSVAWVNDLTRDELIGLFEVAGMELVKEQLDKYAIFVFESQR